MEASYLQDPFMAKNIAFALYLQVKKHICVQTSGITWLLGILYLCPYSFFPGLTELHDNPLSETCYTGLLMFVSVKPDISKIVLLSQPCCVIQTLVHKCLDNKTV